jgi:hypothetical protein
VSYDRQKKIITIIIAALIILIVALLSFLIFNRRLKKDKARSILVAERVDKAQYRPDPDNLVKAVNMANAAPMNAESQLKENSGYHEVSVSKIDKTGFIGILNELTQIEGVGTGKYLGYDIFEIKREISFVVKNAPYFNQWFRLPWMSEDNGYVTIPYYQYWAFFLESDHDARNITITRVSWATALIYYDFDQKSSNRFHFQYQVMKTKYYFDEQNREVVECFVYNVAEVNGEFIPTGFEYLKNVKDTSLTLYRVVIEESYNDNEVGDEGGLDIRGNYPYGTTRDFIELNYSNENDIQLLKISQILPTDVYKNPPTTDIAFYNLTEEGVQFLVHTYDYASVTEKAKLFSLHEHQSQFDEFDATYHFIRSGSLGKFSRIKPFDNYSEMPTRTLTSAQALGNENALLRALQETIIKMAENLDIDCETSLPFKNAFEEKTTIFSTDLSAEKALDDFLFFITKNIVDNSHLKSEWNNIFQSSEKAVKTAIIYGPFKGKNAPLADFASYVDFSYIDTGEASLSANTKIIDQQYADCQIRLALRSDDGEYTILFLESKTTSDKYYTYYRCSGGKLKVSLNKEGVYTAVFVLTRMVDGIETVVLDTLHTPYVFHCMNVILPDTITQNGDIMSYEIDASGRMLVITAKKADEQNLI